MPTESLCGAMQGNHFCCDPKGHEGPHVCGGPCNWYWTAPARTEFIIRAAAVSGEAQKK